MSFDPAQFWKQEDFEEFLRHLLFGGRADVPGSLIIIREIQSEPLPNGQVVFERGRALPLHRILYVNQVGQGQRTEEIPQDLVAHFRRFLAPQVDCMMDDSRQRVLIRKESFSCPGQQPGDEAQVPEQLIVEMLFILHIVH